MRIWIFLFAMFLLMGFAMAHGEFCIDFDSPSAPSNLSVSGEVGSILLEWAAASDEPDCSGIDYYNITREREWIGQVDGDVLRFVDNASLGVGWYNYTVYAVDLVGHNVGAAVKSKVVLVKKGNGPVYVGGGGGSSSRCYEDWVCGEWGECVGGYKERECLDMQMCGPLNDRPEVRMVCGGDEIRVGGSGGVVKDDSGDDGFFSVITGGVVGVVGSTGGVVAGVFVLVVLGGFFAMRIRSRRLSED